MWQSFAQSVKVREVHWWKIWAQGATKNVHNECLMPTTLACLRCKETTATRTTATVTRLMHLCITSWWVWFVDLPNPTEKYLVLGGVILSWRLDDETFFSSRSNWKKGGTCTLSAEMCIYKSEYLHLSEQGYPIMNCSGGSQAIKTSYFQWL